MKLIEQQIPEGKTLKVAGLVFTGPCAAKARVPEDAEPYLIDTPQPVQPDETQLQHDAATQELAVTERQMPAAVEELIDALIAKSTIKLTDLSAETQQLLNKRKAARQKLTELETVEREL